MRTASASYTAWRETAPMLGPHDLVDVVGRAVGPVGHRSQHGQTLRRDLQAGLAEHGARR